MPEIMPEITDEQHDAQVRELTVAFVESAEGHRMDAVIEAAGLLLGSTLLMRVHAEGGTLEDAVASAEDCIQDLLDFTTDNFEGFRPSEQMRRTN